MHIQTVSVWDVIPYENNPRVNDAAVDAVAESIRQCGYRAKIIVDENMVVLAGHTRLKAIKKLGWDEVEVQVEDNLTEEQKIKYRMLDNKTNELAEWDFDALKEELEKVDFEGFDFGFDSMVDMEPQENVAKDDEFDAKLPEEPKSHLGQIYKLGRHRLMCGDGTSLDDVSALCDGKTVDMLLTDPPYGVSYQDNMSEEEARILHRKVRGAGTMSIVNDNLKGDEFAEFLTNAFTSAKSCMRDGACFYIWYADSKGWYFHEALRRVGLEVRQVIVWAKDRMAFGRQDYQWKHEPCLYGWKDGAGHLWTSDRKQTTIMEFSKPSNSELHPTMKPVELFDYQIKNNTRNGDIVLDIFGWSGTSLIACEQNGRTCYMMEMDPKYLDVIIERWETLTGNKAELIYDPEV